MAKEKMTKQEVTELGLQIDKMFTTLDAYEPQIIGATLMLFSFKLRDECPGSAMLLGEMGYTMALGEPPPGLKAAMERLEQEAAAKAAKPKRSKNPWKR